MSSNSPFVSVVIPTYNRSNFVTKAIDSVLDQLFTDYEIIVIDDGSTDDTEQKLESYKHKIRYFYQINSGVSAARNRGITIASGEWVAFLDSDDEWKVDYLSKQVKRLKDYPEIVMQVANCLYIGLDGMKKSYFEINGVQDEFLNKEYLFLEKPFSFIVNHGPWQVGAALFRLDAIKIAGGFDCSLNHSEDFDLVSRMALEGSVGFIKEELVYIYRRDEVTECLTNRAKKDPLQTREGFEKILQKLKALKILQNEDKKALNYLLSSNRRAIGNLLLENGDLRAARSSFKKAALFKLSLASLGKYIFSLLPIETCLWLNRKLFVGHDK